MLGSVSKLWCRELNEVSDLPQTAKTSRPGLVARFAREKAGNVAMIFALTIVPVIGLVGGAVEFGKSFQERTKLQAALDGAVLAAGREFQVTGSQSAAKERAVAFFNESMSNGASGAITKNTVDPQSNILTLGGQVSSPSPFLSIVGVKSITVVAEAQAMLAVGGNSEVNLEVSLMLDITGSMSGSKIMDLKAAAKDLIDIVVWDDQSEWYSKVALAPFSPYVNLGGYFKAVTNRDPYGTGYNRTCVKERVDVERYLDGPPTNNWHFVAYGWNSIGAVVRERDYDCKTKTPIQPLTKDKDLLKSVIDSMSAGGSTAGHLGTAWSWYMLSPRWSNIWKGENLPGPYNDPTIRKIAVLMTDGQYNTRYNGPQSTRQARRFCESMKLAGLEIFTIGFQLDSRTALATLRDYCASDRSHHYDADSGDALRQAFRDIALRLAQLRLSK